MKRTAAALAAVGALALGMGAAQAADPLKVGFVYVGPVGDFGYSYQHDQGRKAVEEKFGDKVKTSFVENVPEGADAERVIRQLAQTGHELIFTTSFGFMNPTIKVAKQFPNVKFEHATGYKRADNVATYAARFYEGRYVAGVIAGKMTKSNVIGYVGSFPIPEVVRGINSFMRGAWSVNPDVKVKIVWVNSWYDPGKEGDAAKALIDQGADIMVQHTDSPAPLQVAENRGIKGFGQASDMIKFAPKAQLSAIVDHWDEYYIDRVQAAMDGTWKAEDTWHGLKEGMVHMAPFTNMPDDVAALAKETEEKIASGDIKIFEGPIYDQAGELRVKEGEVAPDEMLLGMDWYVKGIDAELPK
ncbi:BMP family ABC transporter substrate-binding protein [Thalassospira marina]|uniref:BMP family ABC transporter substrate-binding protein n=1 Tax=Thalassospira marina TaxID=2048283 RepID=A0A2N3KGW4_9PROT|nr:BMP family ABC transporter substrate-binding protein [Thalassospira marina]AUG55199.1 BMP family ABC transporter substrate-binding protein [Thalassospira marina]PKR49760.1 BMP family ABC transporter substrate-binding protein [Thalassospira marina]